MRQLVMGALLAASLPLIPSAFRANRIYGATVVVLLASFDSFALLDTPSRLLVVLTARPTTTVLTLFVLVGIAWALGPGGPVWLAAINSKAAETLRAKLAQAGLSSPIHRQYAAWALSGVLVCLIVVLLQKRIDPYETALEQFRQTVARDLPSGDEATRKATADTAAEVRPRGELQSAAALAAFRATLPSRLQACFIRLDATGTTPQRLSAARADAERLTSSLSEQARGFAKAAGEAAIGAAVDILRSSAATVEGAAQDAMARTRDRSTEDAIQGILRTPKDNLDASISMFADASSPSSRTCGCPIEPPFGT